MSDIDSHSHSHSRRPKDLARIKLHRDTSKARQRRFLAFIKKLGRYVLRKPSTLNQTQLTTLLTDLVEDETGIIPVQEKKDIQAFLDKEAQAKSERYSQASKRIHEEKTKAAQTLLDLTKQSSTGAPKRKPTTIVERNRETTKEKKLRFKHFLEGFIDVQNFNLSSKTNVKTMKKHLETLAKQHVDIRDQINLFLHEEEEQKSERYSQAKKKTLEEKKSKRNDEVDDVDDIDEWDVDDEKEEGDEAGLLLSLQDLAEIQGITRRNTDELLRQVPLSPREFKPSPLLQPTLSPDDIDIDIRTLLTPPPPPPPPSPYLDPFFELPSPTDTGPQEKRKRDEEEEKKLLLLLPGRTRRQTKKLLSNPYQSGRVFLRNGNQDLPLVLANAIHDNLHGGIQQIHEYNDLLDRWIYATHLTYHKVTPGTRFVLPPEEKDSNFQVYTRWKYIKNYDQRMIKFGERYYYTYYGQEDPWERKWTVNDRLSNFPKALILEYLTLTDKLRKDLRHSRFKEKDDERLEGMKITIRGNQYETDISTEEIDPTVPSIESRKRKSETPDQYSNRMAITQREMAYRYNEMLVRFNQELNTTRSTEVVFWYNSVPINEAVVVKAEILKKRIITLLSQPPNIQRNQELRSKRIEFMEIIETNWRWYDYKHENEVNYIKNERLPIPGEEEEEEEKKSDDTNGRSRRRRRTRRTQIGTKFFLEKDNDKEAMKQLLYREKISLPNAPQVIEGLVDHMVHGTFKDNLTLMLKDEIVHEFPGNADFGKINYNWKFLDVMKKAYKEYHRAYNKYWKFILMKYQDQGKWGPEEQKWNSTSDPIQRREQLKAEILPYILDHKLDVRISASRKYPDMESLCEFDDCLNMGYCRCRFRIGFPRGFRYIESDTYYEDREAYDSDIEGEEWEDEEEEKEAEEEKRPLDEIQEEEEEKKSAPLSKKRQIREDMKGLVVIKNRRYAKKSKTGIQTKRKRETDGDVDDGDEEENINIGFFSGSQESYRDKMKKFLYEKEVFLPKVPKDIEFSVNRSLNGTYEDNFKKYLKIEIEHRFQPHSRLNRPVDEKAEQDYYDFIEEQIRLDPTQRFPEFKRKWDANLDPHDRIWQLSKSIRNLVRERGAGIRVDVHNNHPEWRGLGPYPGSKRSTQFSDYEAMVNQYPSIDNSSSNPIYIGHNNEEIIELNKKNNRRVLSTTDVPIDLHAYTSEDLYGHYTGYVGPKYVLSLANAYFKDPAVRFTTSGTLDNVTLHIAITLEGIPPPPFLFKHDVYWHDVYWDFDMEGVPYDKETNTLNMSVDNMDYLVLRVWRFNRLFEEFKRHLADYKEARENAAKEAMLQHGGGDDDGDDEEEEKKSTPPPLPPPLVPAQRAQQRAKQPSKSKKIRKQMKQLTTIKMRKKSRTGPQEKRKRDDDTIADGDDEERSTKEAKDDNDDKQHPSVFRFKSRAELYHYLLQQDEQHQVAFDQLVHNIKRGPGLSWIVSDENLAKSKLSTVILGKGRDRTVYQGELFPNQIQVAYCSSHARDCAYHAFISSYCPNTVRVEGYSRKKHLMFMELLHPMELMHHKYTAEESQKPFLGLCFTFLICFHILGINRSEWAPYRNWGVRKIESEDGEELNYDALGKILGFSKLRIKVSKGEYIPVLFDYWRKDAELFHVYQIQTPTEESLPYLEDDKFDKTRLTENTPTQMGISDAMHYATNEWTAHETMDILHRPKPSSTIYSILKRDQFDDNDLRRIINVLEANTLDWLIVGDVHLEASHVGPKEKRKREIIADDDGERSSNKEAKEEEEEDINIGFFAGYRSDKNKMKQFLYGSRRQVFLPNAPEELQWMIEQTLNGSFEDNLKKYLEIEITNVYLPFSRTNITSSREPTPTYFKYILDKYLSDPTHEFDRFKAEWNANSDAHDRVYQLYKSIHKFVAERENEINLDIKVNHSEWKFARRHRYNSEEHRETIHDYARDKYYETVHYEYTDKDIERLIEKNNRKILSTTDVPVRSLEARDISSMGPKVILALINKDMHPYHHSVQFSTSGTPGNVLITAQVKFLDVDGRLTVNQLNALRKSAGITYWAHWHIVGYSDSENPSVLYMTMQPTTLQDIQISGFRLFLRAYKKELVDKGKRLLV